MGAVLHALCIAHSLVSRDCPSPSELGTIIDSADRIPDIVSHDAELGTWRSAFDRESGSFDEAWKEEVRKTREAVRAVGAITTNATARERYRNVVNGLQLRDPARRGSGMLTAVAATALAWCERSPAEALRLAANAVGTDTDTIATMAGAILGAVAAEEPPVEVLDAELFRSEADRMAKIAEGDNPPNHRYPDLLHWKAPSTRSDALVSSKDGQLVVRGMGNVSKSLGDPIGGPNGSFLWQWIKLELGQTMLIKRRRSLASAAGSKSEGHEPQTWSLAQKTPTESFDVAELPRSSDLRNVLAFVEQHIDNDEQIGRALRRVVSKGSTGQIHEFTGKLIDLLQRARPRLEERNAALVSNVARGEQQIAPL